MRYDVTSKNLAKKIKKDGTTSKVNDIKATYKAGNIIVTNFGEFVAVGAEQIIHTSASGKQYKQWMVTLKNSRGTYKMTHNQAHKNKRIPKSAKLEQVIIAGLLPAPMELIDRLVKEVDKFNEQHNIPTSQVAINMGFKMSFNDKLRHIRMACKRGWRPLRQIRNQLLQYYHPDHYTGQNQPQLNLLYNL